VRKLVARFHIGWDPQAEKPIKKGRTWHGLLYFLEQK